MVSLFRMKRRLRLLLLWMMRWLFATRLMVSPPLCNVLLFVQKLIRLIGQQDVCSSDTIKPNEAQEDDGQIAESRSHSAGCTGVRSDILADEASLNDLMNDVDAEQESVHDERDKVDDQDARQSTVVPATSPPNDTYDFDGKPLPPQLQGRRLIVL